MPRLEWAMTCDHAFVDPDEKLYILGTFSNIWAPRFPATHGSFFVLTQWTGDPGEHALVKIRILGPGDALVIEGADAPVEVKGGTFTLLSRFTVIPFSMPGEYTVQVSADGQVVRALRLTVSQRE